ncbi:transporter substrate-binding domain-containing protein [Salinicola aestuarinus]|uniref:transporter substrate-binding domain-containing protein n=1 Tax=Salinicola aestuarinus TaxID=1949082 RepID=UPI000DA1CF2D|nr:transporter substrate-binding domain-containing protein [Salinicola aestuarinus]
MSSQISFASSKRLERCLKVSVLTLGLGISAAQASAPDSYHVALDGTFAPHAMPTMSGDVQGFNVDLANALGEQLGAEMQITSTQFSGLIPGLQAGTYDFLMAPTTVTEERAANLLFSEGYLDTDFQFVVKKGAPDITDLHQLDGQVVAVNKGSAYDSWAREHAEEYGWRVEAYGTNSDAIQAVMSGRAAANVAGNTVSAYAVSKNPAIELSYLVETGLVWAIPFRKDDSEDRDRVERALECLKMNGVMAELSEKWFGVEPAEDATAVTPIHGFGQPGFSGYVEDEHAFSCD